MHSIQSLEKSDFAFEESVSRLAAFKLPNVGISRIAGPDAIRYANGRLTQNISDLKVGQAKEFMLLEPKGRPLALGNIARLAEDELLVLSSSQSQVPFAKSFLQFKVADQLDLTEMNSEYELIALAGLPTDKYPLLFTEKLFTPPMSGNASSEIFSKQQIYCLASRPYFQKVTNDSGTSIHILFLAVPSSCLESLISTLNDMEIPLFSDSDFELLRIALMIPSTFELDNKCIATDLNYQPYISHTKGCYAGQEVVEMSTARGRPNKRQVLLRVKGSSQVSLGQEIKFTSDEQQEPKLAGSVTSAICSKKFNASFCLAFVKNSIDSGAQFFIDDKPCDLLTVDT